MGEAVRLGVSLGGKWEDRRDDAAYGFVDGQSKWGKLHGSCRVGDQGLLELAAESGDRDYESRDVPGESPFYDSRWDRVTGVYSHRIARGWSAVLRGGYAWRDYEQEARDEEGTLLVGKDREDRRPEAGAEITGVPASRTGIRGGYHFLENRSTGSYYEYRRHRVFGILFQKLTSRFAMHLYLHRQWKSYEDQVAYSDPFVNQVPEGSREDGEWMAQVGGEYKLMRYLSVVAEYTYLENQSNDESSEYENHSVLVGCRWDF